MPRGIDVRDDQTETDYIPGSYKRYDRRILYTD